MICLTDSLPLWQAVCMCEDCGKNEGTGPQVAEEVEAEILPYGAIDVRVLVLGDEPMLIFKLGLGNGPGAPVTTMLSISGVPPELVGGYMERVSNVLRNICEQILKSGGEQ